MVRKRVWLNSPDHNYNDRKKKLIDENNYDQFKLYEEENTHFNHGDFLNSSCITIPTVEILESQPNYLLIFNGSNIESRWFVNNFQFISGEPKSNKSKFTASLLRDTVVDNRQRLGGALMKCRRGTLPNEWSPLLVQPEGEFLNKIKVNQELLKLWDGDTRWLTILYDQTKNVTIEFDWANDIAPDFQLSTMQNDFTTRNFSQPLVGDNISNAIKRSWAQWEGTVVLNGYVQSYYNGTWNNEESMSITLTLTLSPSGNSVTNISSDPPGDNIVIIGTTYQSARNSARDWLLGNFGGSSVPALNNLDYDYTSNYSFLRNKYASRIITDGVNNIRSSFNTSTEESTQTSGLGPINNGIAAAIGSFEGPIGGTKGTVPINVRFRCTSAGVIGSPSLILRVDSFATALSTIPNTGTLQLPQSFKLDEMNIGCVAIPYGQGVSINSPTGIKIIDEQTIKSIATTGWTSADKSVFDIQILPYCPVGVLNSVNSSLPMTNQIPTNNLPNQNILVPLTVTGSETILYYGFANTQSSMDYRYNITLGSFVDTNNIKMDSMTKSIRLCSHNHKSTFEYTPMLDGVRSTIPISISYTIRPYNTIFRICPVFSPSGLYGGNFKDGRGLVFEGGTSLPQIADAWTEYKLQNSTYEALFDREVKNLEVNNEGARLQETLTYTTANQNANTQIQASKDKAALALGMGLMSAGVGVATGNPMALMGAVGGLASAASTGMGIAAQEQIASNNLRASKESQVINEGLRSESLGYKSDIFALNNQAIQARPNTIASGTDYSHVNELKCYIEFYDCTLQEKQFLQTKLELQGMKVGALGNMGNFMDSNKEWSYIEGATVFDVNSNPIIGNSINSELSRGCYIEGGLFND